MKLYLPLVLFGFVLPAAMARADSVTIPEPDSFASGQTDPQWGWAACNQMVLNAVGAPDHQDDQVEKLFGSAVSRDIPPGAAGFDPEVKALTGSYVNTTGSETDIAATAVSYAAPNHPNQDGVIVDALKNGWPVIIVTKNHRYVAYGATYTGSGAAATITSFQLIDPQHGLDAKIPLLSDKAVADLQKEGYEGFISVKVH